MNFKNLALGYVATAPSPAKTGKSLVLDSGEGARFPQPSTDGDFYVTAMPPGENPNITNSEILKVTARSTDTLTIVREQGDTTAKTIEEGWIILQSIYKENILDEDDMASNSATALATQQSIAAAIGGWLTAGISGVTVTRASIDDPTVVLTFAGTDVTSYIWKGTRIKLDEGGTTHYMIVSKDPTFSTDTTVTCLMEIDTATPTQASDPVSTGTISNVAYAPPKTYPSGFPISPLSWTVITKDTSLRTVASPSGNTWYNLGSVNLSIPIGDWATSYSVSAFYTYGSGSSADVYLKTTLSTANNSESDADFTTFFGGRTSTAIQQRFGQNLMMKKQLTLTSKTVYYLNTSHASQAADNIYNRGDVSPTTIKAVSTLL